MQKIIIVLVVLAIGASIIAQPLLGIGGFGPTRTFTVTVSNTYVDTSNKEKSHYMVGTDIGSFEVDNGILLGVWNADEIFGKIKSGKTYEITTKGNRFVNILFQEYPYIISVK